MNIKLFFLFYIVFVINCAISIQARQTGDAEARLPIDSAAAEVWQQLLATLHKLDVKIIQQDARHFHLQTDWVNWQLNQHGEALLRGSFYATLKHRTDVRHRFAFSIEARANGHSVLVIRDVAFQQLQDITPGSSHAWNKWIDQPVHYQAVKTFAGAFWGSYTTTIRTRVAVSESDAPTAQAPAAPAPAASAPAPRQDSLAPQRPRPALATAHTQITAYHQAVRRDIAAKLQGNSLVVEGAYAEVLLKFQKALLNKNISIDNADRQRGLLTTGWVDAYYDEQGKLLRFADSDNIKWGFSFSGESLKQRHKFRFKLVNAADKNQTAIYAYHIEVEQLVDVQADSSQSVLAWQKLKTRDEVATDFLRELSRSLL